MYLHIALPLAAAAFLSACSQATVRDSSIVERPAVARENVIERPVASPAAGGSVVAGSAPSCTRGTQDFSPGTLSCQAGVEYRCVNGIWERSARAC